MLCAPAVISNRIMNQTVKPDGGALRDELNFAIMKANLLPFEMCAVYHKIFTTETLSHGELNSLILSVSVSQLHNTNI
jgi:hypothetical protein